MIELELKKEEGKIREDGKGDREEKESADNGEVYMYVFVEDCRLQVPIRRENTTCFLQVNYSCCLEHITEYFIFTIHFHPPYKILIIRTSF